MTYLIYRDKNGRQIYPGDLLKTFHFQEARTRRIHYLYHVAVLVGGHIKIIPTSHLEPTMKNDGGSCWIKSVADADGYVDSEIIHGYSGEFDDGDFHSFEERPKVYKTHPAPKGNQ